MLKVEQVNIVFNADNGEWNLAAAATSSYSYAVKQSADKVENKNYYSLADTNASWMLFPQEVNGKVISITYSTKQGAMEVFSGTKKVTLPSDAKWTVGQNVLYVLTLPAVLLKLGLIQRLANGILQTKKRRLLNDKIGTVHDLA